MKKLLLFAVMYMLLWTSRASAQEISDTVVLPGIEVEANMLKISRQLIYTVTKGRIEGASARDIGDFLRSVPNVSGIRKGGASLDPVVRGFKFSQLNVLLDGGIKIENGCPNRMDPVNSHVEAEDLQKIDVIKGPYVLQYGPSLGGIVNLVTEKPRPFSSFELHARASYGFESNWNGQREHLTLYGGNKKIYFLVSGNYKDYGNYSSGKINGEDTLFKSAFKKYDYSVKLGYTINEKQNLLVSFTDTKGRDVLYPALPMDEKSDDTWIAFADYTIRDINKLFRSLSFKLYRTNVDHVMDNRFRSNYSSRQMIADVDAVNTGGRAYMEMSLNKHKLDAGVDVENIYKDGTRTMTMQMMGTASTKKTNLWYEANIRNYGCFVNYHVPFRSIQLNASIRFDYNQATSKDTLILVREGTEYFKEVNSNFFNISGNIGVTKHFSDQLSVSLYLAHGVRNPNNLERFIKLMAVGYDNYDYLGNPRLKPESNNEADLTFNYSHDAFGVIYLNGFFSYIQNFITANLLPSSVVTPQTQGVLGVKQFYNADYVTLKGFEFSYSTPEKYKWGGTMNVAYTYALIPNVTKYIISENQIVGEVNVKDDALSEIPPLEANVALYYKLLNNKLIPRIVFRAVADQHHVSEASYEPSTPGYATWAFSCKYNFKKHFELNAGINNIFNRSYYEHLNRKIIGYAGKLYEPGRVFYFMLTVKI